MPKIIAPLTDIQVKNAKAKDKSYKLSDGGGLYLEVSTKGTRFWRMKVKQSDGKENRLSFGPYPAVSLAEARKCRDTVKKQKISGIDPILAKRIIKQDQNIANANTFEVIARAWLIKQADSWQERTAKNVLHRLEKDVFPSIGTFPITKLDAPTMLALLRTIEKRGAVNMAKRQGQVCSQIFRFAIAEGKAINDPMPNLRGALKASPKGHHAAITTAELPEFLSEFRKIEGRMYVATRVLFKLMMLTFVRTSELTTTEWSEIDFKNEKWVIPWQRMKMGKKKLNPRKVNHEVFLPLQGWKLLKELHAVTGNNKYLFPNLRDHEKPATDYGVLAALKRMGYFGRMTGHGFRSLAMGIIKERLGYRHEVVDRQLSHASGDKYGEAYDRAMFFVERKKMMQDYADYLDGVGTGKIIDIQSMKKSA